LALTATLTSLWTVIGPLEIAIIAVILIVIFGYKFADRLPGLGRRAGESAREVKDTVSEAVGDKADPKTLGQTAGKGLREAREFRDALTGKTPPEPAERQPAASEPAPAESRPEEDSPER
jgi:Sec-independent protein translocase protein TatA